MDLFIVGLQEIEWVMGHLNRWEHAIENLESQVLLIAQSICAALDDANLIVESFDKIPELPR